MLFPAMLGAAAAAALLKSYGATPFDAAFNAAAKRHSVPANLLRAIARHESGFDPNARGAAGEVGMMQLLPRTAAPFLNGRDLSRPDVNVDVAAAYLAAVRRELGERFSPWAWPMAYNAGPDLEPRAKAERYGSAVLWHWSLYDMGRIFA